MPNSWQRPADQPLMVIKMVVYLPLAWRHESPPLQSHCCHTLDPAPAAQLGVFHFSSSTGKEGASIRPLPVRRMRSLAASACKSCMSKRPDCQGLTSPR